MRGTAIERLECGAEALIRLNVPTEALAVIERVEAGQVILAP